MLERRLQQVSLQAGQYERFVASLLRSLLARISVPKLEGGLQQIALIAKCSVLWSLPWWKVLKIFESRIMSDDGGGEASAPTNDIPKKG